MKFLTVFHPLADKEEKYRFMFKLYDLDGDEAVTNSDLVAVFKLVYMQSAMTFRP
jgi:Ca2+-binding EF-hand superfamily protein